MGNKRLGQYEDIGTVKEFEKLKQAEKEGRILPKCSDCKYKNARQNYPCPACIVNYAFKNEIYDKNAVMLTIGNYFKPKEED